MRADFSGFVDFGGDVLAVKKNQTMSKIIREKSLRLGLLFPLDKGANNVRTRVHGLLLSFEFDHIRFDGGGSSPATFKID